MPRSNGEGDHGELSQDERGEADGHNVDKLLLKQQKGPKHDNTALIN